MVYETTVETESPYIVYRESGNLEHGVWECRELVRLVTSAMGSRQMCLHGKERKEKEYMLPRKFMHCRQLELSAKEHRFRFSTLFNAKIQVQYSFCYKSIISAEMCSVAKKPSVQILYKLIFSIKNIKFLF